MRTLGAGEINRVIDTCYQCKLCYVKCPYTPDDQHEFQLDFPRLLLRANAVRKKETGIGLREQLLARPEMIGKLTGATPGLANWANRKPALRVAGEHSAVRFDDRQIGDTRLSSVQYVKFSFTPVQRASWSTTRIIRPSGRFQRPSWPN